MNTIGILITLHANGVLDQAVTWLRSLRAPAADFDEFVSGR